MNLLYVLLLLAIFIFPIIMGIFLSAAVISFARDISGRVMGKSKLLFTLAKRYLSK